MEIQNMSPSDLEAVETTLEGLIPNNPQLQWNAFMQNGIVNKEKETGDAPDLITRVKELSAEVSLLKNLINNIFGDYVLINGQWKQIKL